MNDLYNNIQQKIKQLDTSVKMNKWKEDTLRLKVISDNSIKRKCGHSIFTSDKEIICRWCGRKVYRPKEEFKIMLKRALERE